MKIENKEKVIGLLSSIDALDKSINDVDNIQNSLDDFPKDGAGYICTNNYQSDYIPKSILEEACKNHRANLEFQKNELIKELEKF